MPYITSRIPFTHNNPYRPKRPSTEKLIFLSCEGSVTEEEYFEAVADIFSEVKSKIQFVSVAEDATHTRHTCRTKEQVELLSKTRPRQLVERLTVFKSSNSDKFEFEKYPEDEFWIVTDVDKNWSDEKISGNKTYKEEWEEAIKLCELNGYHYAISNPFFEMWLLLHHDECTNEDKAFAVTPEHSYTPTSHFKNRLRLLNVKLKDKKHILFDHYNAEKIESAIKRAKALHIDENDLQPCYFATTVYILLEKIYALM